MKRLGISIYPDKVGVDKTIEYVKLAHKYGFKRIFANLLLIPNDEEGKTYIRQLKNIFSIGKKLGFDIFIDVDPYFYKVHNIDPKDFSYAKKMNASGIRFDGDFGGEIEAFIAKNNENFLVELNASAGEDIISKTIIHGGKPENIVACHNFYPMRNSGISFEKFIERSALIKKQGVRVAAFIGLEKKYDGVGPWDVNDGLVTIEKIRDMPTELQLAKMLEYSFIDDICLGEQPSNNKDAEILFKKLNRVWKKYYTFVDKDIIELRAKIITKNSLEREIILKPNNMEFHRPRQDLNDFFVRSTMPRVWYKDKNIPMNNTKSELTVGDIVIVNKTYGKYKGELHIMFDSLKLLDETRNYVGKIIEDDQIYLSWIKNIKNKIKIIEYKGE